MTKMATLRLEVENEILVFGLESVLGVINHAYTSLRWLHLAERHEGSGPYPDSQFAQDEFLRVRRLEIGTPNYIELYGVYEALQETLKYLVAVGGISAIVTNGADKAIDLRRKWIDHKDWEPLRKAAEQRKLDAEAEKISLEAEKLKRDLRQAPIPVAIVARTQSLVRQGRASQAVLAYKTKRDLEVNEMLQYWPLDHVVQAWALTPDDGDDA